MLLIPQLITGVSLRLGIPRRVALQRSSSPLPQPSPVSPERLHQSTIIQQMGVFNTADRLTFGVHGILFNLSVARSNANPALSGHPRQHRKAFLNRCT
jgi:hypothetical protein